MGFHIQRPTPNWTDALPRLPDYSLVKAVDEGGIFAEVKAVNPKIFTCLRHWYDPNQQFGGSYEANKQKARVFFDTFIDGTFIEKLAQHTDFIEEWNEYLANSQNATEINDRLTWARAAADVWATEYRTRAPLRHIRLVLCNTAIGNDIHRGFAEIALSYDAVVGYHPYTHWKQKQRSPDDWRWLSGRWNYMEQAWGLKPNWIFTEAGPFESAVSGWRDDSCLGFDHNLYVEAMRQWIRDTQQTAAYREGRLFGFSIFTTGGGDQWQHFETGQPELNMLADMIRDEWKPGTVTPPPPPPPVEDRGKPRIQYHRIANVIPTTATVERAVEIFADRWQAAKETVTGSYDDAGIGDLDHRIARLHDIPAERHQEFRDWYAAHYPGVSVEFWAINQTEPGVIHEVIDVVDDLPKHETLRYDTRPLTDITTIVIHHTVSPCDRSTEAIARYHVAADENRNKSEWPGIGYHYVIGCDGKIEQTNYDETISYHSGVRGHPEGQYNNNYTLAVALKDSFQDHPPTQEAQDAARWLVADKQKQLGPMIIKKHGDMPGAQTACPGNTSPDWFPYVAGYVDG